jgi:hypothetical protein
MASFAFGTQRISQHNLQYIKLFKGIFKDDRLDGVNQIVYKIFLELEQEV